MYRKILALYSYTMKTKKMCIVFLQELTKLKMESEDKREIGQELRLAGEQVRNTVRKNFRLQVIILFVSSTSVIQITVFFPLASAFLINGINILWLIVLI